MRRTLKNIAMNTKPFTKKDAAIIESGLDWIERMFRPELYERWEKDPGEHYTSTLKAYCIDLEKFSPHLPGEKIIELKNAITIFLKVQKKFKETKLIVFKTYYNYVMNEKNKIVFSKVTLLLKDKNQEKFTLVNY